ncbi:phospholipid carrier-dependent glycosyltransferase [Micromonospora sp. DR5-3]|uniref:dolichyl-phosphate-mannose--protein mannosyltransferase n=1 Tax=unclassified Micromonospora TaxID=2617518 RepID=UPI0011D309BB|nr:MULTISPECIES: phospholipid carrier-dependent glycosyltransferase [unclassified Micromonospora]MCW3816161.1 phospholipid carrier-dependent glycosyltransferase [Micromonospora sp. DR5-3]TYC25174.1 phospholipid carrier-dependent glycosyltransferase [Micromonospora sp. MP36]
MAAADTYRISAALRAEAERAATGAPNRTGSPGDLRREVPESVRRRLAPFDAGGDRSSWWATTLIVVIAGVLRLVNLDSPKGKIFDELYYATEAHHLLLRGFEWNEKTNSAAYVVHPPLGKWMIGLGELVFGYNETGWRISAAVVGTLSVLILVRVARRMFRSTVLGCAAGLLMALDGMHLVLSRVALLDIFLMFFILAAFGTLLLDRDAHRRRWLTALEAGLDPAAPGPAGRLPFTVPWWRLATFVLLGCACAVKWSGIWYVLVFTALMLHWAIQARRSAGVPRPWRDALVREVGWVALGGALLLLVYLASWSGWLLTDGGHFRHWLRDTGGTELPVVGALQNLWHYHVEALQFHTTLEKKHAYQSWPWQWLLLGRPVAFDWWCPTPCSGSAPAREVLLLGTPLLWWSFLPALGALTWFGIARRDWRAGAIWLGVLAGLLPWFYFAVADHRTMFYFYALPAEPFLVLAVVHVLGMIMTPRPLPSAAADGTPSGQDRRLIGAIVAGAYVLLVAACFAYFYPIYVGRVLPYTDWAARIWLGNRWI